MITLNTRKAKTMQVTLKIFSEDENHIGDVMIDLINTANDNCVLVDKVTLDGKEIFSLDVGCERSDRKTDI